MAVYAYRAKREPDEVLTGRMEAGSRRQAVQRLRAMELHPLSVRQTGEGLLSGVGSWLPFRRIRKRDLVIFWRQLASLLQAGMPLVDTLATVQEHCERRALAGVIAEVRRVVQHAASFSAALARFPRVFGPVEVNVVAAGEAMGALGQVAGELADRLDRENDLRSSVVATMAYPAFLCVVGGIVVAVLVTFVIPKFATMFQNFGQSLPWPTRLLLAVSAVARGWWWLVGGVALVIGVGLYHLARTERGRLVLDRARLRLPTFGKLLLRIEMERFASTLGTLCANGVKVLPALGIAARTARNKAVALDIQQAQLRVEKGSRVETALRQGDYFPAVLVNMVAIGEDSARLDQMLGRVADLYKRESERSLSTMVRLLESLLIVLLASVVGFIVAAVLLPVFEASTLFG